MKEREQEVLSILPINLRKHLLALNFDLLQEIRLRSGKPVMLRYHHQEYFLSERGTLTTDASEPLWNTSHEEIRQCLDFVSKYSLYAYEEELRQGFITIRGGHRIGIVGKVRACQGEVKNLNYIGSLNIRLSHQMKGCANSVLPFIVSKDKIYSSLIVSPPRCGKTTLLRDLIRQISNGFSECEGKNVGVVDERSELGACYKGIPQNDLGIRTDILDCCPKAEGMMILIRSMSPDMIAIDEIGSQKEVEAMKYAMNCGCGLIATAHGESMEEILVKPVLGQLVKEHAFQRYIVLKKGGKAGIVGFIFDERGNLLYET